jgi:hypothetical protein
LSIADFVFLLLCCRGSCSPEAKEEVLKRPLRKSVFLISIFKQGETSVSILLSV